MSIFLHITVMKPWQTKEENADHDDQKIFRYISAIPLLPITTSTVSSYNHQNFTWLEIDQRKNAKIVKFTVVHEIIGQYFQFLQLVLFRHYKEIAQILKAYNLPTQSHTQARQLTCKMLLLVNKDMII